VTLNPQIKLILDLLPLATFFVGYKWLGLMGATALLLGVTLAILAFTYAVERRVALSPLITAIAVSIFGGLTLWLHDERFIKIKPTLIYCIFSAILIGGCVMRKNLLKPLLGTALHMSERGWYLLSLRWGAFFLSLAALNECIWRNFSTDVWVNFKVFGVLGLTFTFALAQAGFIERHSIPPEPEKEDAPPKNSD
jgi:intracellular septation protein